MSRQRMSQVKKHFENEAHLFDERVARMVPYYAEMLEALVNAMPFAPKADIRVADLGCGTGTVAAFVKKHFPNSRITCVDMSRNMLDIAAAKLGDCKSASYELAELSAYGFKGKFHAILSSLALHHLEPAGKADLREKAFKSLVKGGIFAVADIIVSPDHRTQRMYLEKWGAFVRRSYTEKQLKMVRDSYKREDRPAVLLDEISGLKSAGFKYTDVFWKYYNFAVYGGVK